MPKMTKTQSKNAYKAILSKSRKLWMQRFEGNSDFMSTKDYMAIEAIVSKYEKNFFSPYTDVTKAADFMPNLIKPVVK